MFKKARCPTRPAHARQNVPFLGQGRSMAYRVPLGATAFGGQRLQMRTWARQKIDLPARSRPGEGRERRWQTFSTFPIPINEFGNSFRIKHHQDEWGFNVCPETSWRKATHGWPSSAGPNYLVARGANPKIRRPGKGPEHSWGKFLKAFP